MKHVIFGSNYLNAVWKDLDGMTSPNGINIALKHLFDTPERDMTILKSR